ncbi:F0F1 ATP synthase subunit epsilon [Mangrovicoccus sp. HB161399]|uniref:F0F1 ATP synthase subunit epsilon n=1 Tax=Mangrovicoccus sp. HB161399 TaxID=2720392 RepID=UPI00155544D5|nr:F0F1 ATP synthase subunit epsilon [Mangrovicoccus sp. HB161399]
MSRSLYLTVATPMEILVDDATVAALRAEDASGSFGILPGHVDLLTALPVSILRWRGAQGAPRYCALKSGLMSVTGGREVAVACRGAVLGDDLAALQARIRTLRAEEAEEERKARVEQTRLHARAVREMLRMLRPAGPGGLDHPPAMSAGGGDG